jgi:hypothetical protein
MLPYGIPDAYSSLGAEYKHKSMKSAYGGHGYRKQREYYTIILLIIFVPCQAERIFIPLFYYVG